MIAFIEQLEARVKSKGNYSFIWALADRKLEGASSIESPEDSCTVPLVGIIEMLLKRLGVS